MDTTQETPPSHVTGEASDAAQLAALLDDLESVDPALAPEPAEDLAAALTSRLDATDDAAGRRQPPVPEVDLPEPRP
jgi:hypothetical protein